MPGMRRLSFRHVGRLIGVFNLQSEHDFTVFVQGPDVRLQHVLIRRKSPNLRCESLAAVAPNTRIEAGVLLSVNG